MPNHRYKLTSAMIALLSLLSAAVVLPVSAAEDGTAGSSDAQAEGDAAGEGQKQAPEKPSEMNKVPLAQLVQRAKAGDHKAEFELGSRMNYGRSMPKDIKEGLRWLKRAAQGGLQDAQRLLAVKFYYGYDVPVDQTEALYWTQQMADAGDVPAQLTLANMYSAGEGVARNLVRASMWYSIAASAAGQKDAPEALETAAKTAAERRDKLVSLLLPEQEVEAQRMASEWWLKKQGVSLAEKTSTAGSGKAAKAKH